MHEVSSIKYTTLLGTESELKLNTDGTNFDVTIVSKNIFQRMLNACSGKDWSTTTKITNSYELLRQELPADTQKVVDEYASTFRDEYERTHNDFTHFEELKKMMEKDYFAEKEEYQDLADKTSKLIRVIRHENPRLDNLLQKNYIHLNRYSEDLEARNLSLKDLKERITHLTCKLISEIDYIKSFEISKPFSYDDAIGKEINVIKRRCEDLGFKIIKKPLPKTHENLRAEISSIIFQIGNAPITVDEDNKSDLIDILEATTSDKKMNADAVKSLAKKFLKTLEKLKLNNPSISPSINLRIEDLKKLAREVGINLDR